jgi:phosphoadenosine phosphosulfate reductase
VNKIDNAVERIKEAYTIAENLGNVLVLAYSGGKDSDILLDLAVKSGVQFTAQHNHTTVDAPETIYHIREVFAKLNARGITAIINYPDEIETADGKRKRASMWNLIVKKQMPPMRNARYCCEFFKERRFDGQHILTGVRWTESPKRKTRGLHETLGGLAENRVIYYDENDDKRKLTEMCRLHARIATNPIIDWSDADVWCCIKENGIKINPLYGWGFRRVGCIGCPMAGGKIMQFEFQMYPKYEAAYIRAFDRMLEYRDGKGNTRSKQWANGKAVMDWWAQRPTAKDGDSAKGPRQMSLFDDEDEEATA